MDNDGGPVVYDWGTLDDDGGPVENESGSMDDFWRRMVDDRWSFHNQQTFLTSPLVSLTLRMGGRNFMFFL